MKSNMLFVGDTESQSILDKFQEQNTNFCIIKDLRKRGLAVWGWNTKENLEEKQQHYVVCYLQSHPYKL